MELAQSAEQARMGGQTDTTVSTIGAPLNGQLRSWRQPSWRPQDTDGAKI